ncbi:unnamed protein product [Brassicogethes aeneus]|uniref:Endonuclease-reverse transcriptase n=1 Tax=Brassicogethes aeneus TaxID=1431903 RepID=A0A9P0AQR7_BRAAE|nr:unnamed protein product [Brassicogethes aeneus]
MEFSEGQKEYLKQLFSQMTQNIETKITTQLTEFKSEVNELLGTCQQKIEKLESENNQLRETVKALDRRIRKNNIVIFGIETDYKNLKQETLALFSEKINIDIKEEDIGGIYFLGPKHKQTKPIIVEFISGIKKDLVFKNAFKLKSSGISISQDLSAEDREINKTLVQHLKAAKKKGLKAYIRGSNLIFGEDTYTVKELKKDLIEIPTEPKPSLQKRPLDEDNPETESSESKKTKGNLSSIRTRQSKLL